MRARDLLLPCALGAAAALELALGGPWDTTTGALVALTFATTAPLAFARVAPLAALLGCLCGITAYSSVIGDGNGPMTMLLVAMIATFIAGANPVVRHSTFAAWAIVVAAIVIPPVSGLGPDNVPFVLVLLGIPWIGGRLTRRHRDLAAELRALAHELERARDEHERAAVLAERARIAAELNDAVAHGVAEVLMQANAASEILELDPDGAASALRTVQDRGRETVLELRRLLLVMREAPTTGPAAPRS